MALDIRGTDSSNHVGGVGGIKLGYNFESFGIGGDFRLQTAVEIEAFYMGTKTNVSYNTSVLGTPVNASIGGNQNDAVFSVNGLLRLKTGTCFTPYIGAGIGAEYLDFTSAHANANILGKGLGLDFADSNDVCLALQAIGGFDFETCKHWTIFTEYKYVATIDPSLAYGNATNIGGIGIDTKFDPNYIGQHFVSAGLKYNSKAQPLFHDSLVPHLSRAMDQVSLSWIRAVCHQRLDLVKVAVENGSNQFVIQGFVHPPDGVSVGCTGADSCPQLGAKIGILMNMINSHTGWDQNMPAPRGGGRHATEIADLWRAYANCQMLYEKKCKNQNLSWPYRRRLAWSRS